MNYDDYFTADDKPFVENINDALLLSNVFNFTVPISFPADFSNGEWVNTTSMRKCSVAIATLKETLPSGVSVSTVDGKSVLTGTGTVKLGFYPNFSSFGKYKAINWTATGSVTVNLKTTTGTTIASNIANGTITSDSVELRTLQEIVVELVLSNATLSSLEIVLENRVKDDRHTVELSYTSLSDLPIVDSALSTTSENAVQNKAIAIALNGKVNNSDVVDNLSSTASGRPLSANQGKILNDTKASISHTHGWVENTLNTYATLYVNEGIRMCELNYVRTFDGADADKFYIWHSGAIPSAYRPSAQVQGVFNQVGIIYVDSTGEIGGKFANAWTGERLCKGSVSWHY